MALRIMLVGNLRPSFSTESHIGKTLESLGHELIYIQEDEHDSEAIYGRVVETNPDLWVWVRTWGIQGDPERLLIQLQEREIPSVSYHLDLYWGISRERTITTDPFWKTQYVFSADGGHQENFKEAGVNHFYIKPAVFAAECHYGQPQRELSYSVGFVGSEQYHPEWPYRPQLINWLRQTYGSEFGKFGYPEWTMRGEDLNNLYASTRVVVGDSLCKDFTQTHYVSDRYFEAPGRGAFQIFPRIKGLEDCFIDGVEMVHYTYGEFDELKEKIDYYLAHPLGRERIRLAGHERVKRDHTYTNRMEEMLGIVLEKAC